VSAALFAIGATVERHQHTEASRSISETSTPTPGTSSETGGEGQHTEGTPSTSETGGEGQPTETHPAPGETTATSSEDLFGINPEAPWVVVLGVAASVLLALAVCFRDRRSVLLIVVVFGLLLAALDLREMVHQVNESRTSLIVGLRGARDAAPGCSRNRRRVDAPARRNTRGRVGGAPSGLRCGASRLHRGPAAFRASRAFAAVCDGARLR